MSKWVAALQEGEYEQCTEYERFVPEGGRVQHDPLGVLGELCQDETEAEIFSAFHYQPPDGTVFYVTNWEALNDWAGWKPGVRYGKGPDGELLTAAMDLNDAGKSFDEIARFLEMAYASF